MDERKALVRELTSIETDLKELSTKYEQYFAGVEKREPMKDRESISGRLRRFVNRRIIQTDLRFRYQNIATRYHSLSGYWDRILREMDEGRYVRHRVRASSREAAPRPDREVDVVYRQLMEARTTCKSGGTPPSRTQLADFLEKQKEKIKEKFGDRQVEFRVAVEDGKPKIKVRPKK